MELNPNLDEMSDSNHHSPIKVDMEDESETNHHTFAKALLENTRPLPLPIKEEIEDDDYFDEAQNEELSTDEVE